MTQTSLIEVGIITAAHGIRGQVKLRSLITPPEKIGTLGPLFDVTGQKRFAIKITSSTDKGFIVSIEGIGDRNDAEKLRGTKLYADAKKLPKSAKATLTGFKALLKDKSPYGKVLGVYNFGAGDIIEIRKENGDAEMLPLNDGFVLNIDRKAQSLMILPPEYIEEKK